MVGKVSIRWVVYLISIAKNLIATKKTATLGDETVETISKEYKLTAWLFADPEKLHLWQMVADVYRVEALSRWRRIEKIDKCSALFEELPAA